MVRYIASPGSPWVISGCPPARLTHSRLASNSAMLSGSSGPSRARMWRCSRSSWKLGCMGLWSVVDGWRVGGGCVADGWLIGGRSATVPRGSGLAHAGSVGDTRRQRYPGQPAQALPNGAARVCRAGARSSASAGAAAGAGTGTGTPSTGAGRLLSQISAIRPKNSQADARKMSLAARVNACWSISRVSWASAADSPSPVACSAANALASAALPGCNCSTRWAWCSTARDSHTVVAIDAPMAPAAMRTKVARPAAAGKRACGMPDRLRVVSGMK